MIQAVEAGGGAAQDGALSLRMDLEQKTSNTTHVEVSARKNLAEWDKEYAQQLVSKIVAKR